MTGPAPGSGAGAASGAPTPRQRVDIRDAIRIVAITDSLRDGIDGLTARVREAVAGGVTMVHVRLPDEPARTLVRVTQSLVEAVPVPVVVHGRVDVALASDAAGVHLGVYDVAPASVRRLLGDGFIVGASAVDAAACPRDVDYVAVGPVFTTGSRIRTVSVIGLEGVAEFAARVPCPLLAIGGITAERVAETRRAGASGVAMLSAVLGAPDPRRAAQAIRSASGS